MSSIFLFQKNLVVWKHDMRGLIEVCEDQFQKNLVVWKRVITLEATDVIERVSEELSSVETTFALSSNSSIL